MDANVGCGCLHTGFDLKATVGQMTVELDVPETFNINKRVDIRGFRSQRMTELFVHDNKQFQKFEAEKMGYKLVENNKKVRDMVKYINEREGWLIVGWYRRGQTKDASNEGATTAAMETKLHIVLLLPMKSNIRKLEDAEFNKLRLGAPNNPSNSADES